MTDAELVAKKLSIITSCVHELRHVARLDLLERDSREQRYIIFTLYMAMQAAIDVASHIGADQLVGEPRTYGDAFVLLAKRDILPWDLAKSLESMAGMRNVIAHVYADLDLARIRDAVEHRLDDLLSFVAAIRPLL